MPPKIPKEGCFDKVYLLRSLQSPLYVVGSRLGETGKTGWLVARSYKQRKVTAIPYRLNPWLAIAMKDPGEFGAPADRRISQCLRHLISCCIHGLRRGGGENVPVPTHTPLDGEWEPS